MAEHSRYSVGSEEVENGEGILKNKLGIKNRIELVDTETVLLADTFNHFFVLFSQDRLKFDLSLLFQIHKYFFIHLYSWAGKIRTVDISKNGMLFASVAHLAFSLKEFESILKLHTPDKNDTKKQIAADLAVLHCELNAIHPFREGNGRTIRLFLDLLASRAEYAPIDWSRKTQDQYIQACIKGMTKQYLPMAKIIYTGLSRNSKS